MSVAFATRMVAIPPLVAKETVFVLLSISGDDVIYISRDNKMRLRAKKQQETLVDIHLEHTSPPLIADFDGDPMEV